MALAGSSEAPSHKASLAKQSLADTLTSAGPTVGTPLLAHWHLPHQPLWEAGKSFPSSLTASFLLFPYS